MLGPEPDVASLYSSKSGSKRIFLSAKVDIPPGQFDIYSLPQVRRKSEYLRDYCISKLLTFLVLIQKN